jgi:hypothetical protein
MSVGGCSINQTQTTEGTGYQACVRGYYYVQSRVMGYGSLFHILSL